MGIKLFDIYRYQIIAIQEQQSLLYDLNELIEKKNEYFENALCDIKSAEDDSFQFTIERQIDHKFIAVISKSKKVPFFTKEHEKSSVSSYPPAHIIVDNDPSYQILAIEKNSYYQNSLSLIKKLSKYINKIINSKNLTIKTSPLYKRKSFWDFIEEHKDNVKKVKFNLITPNMSNISGMLCQQIKDNAKMTRASESVYGLSADGDSHLVIERENEMLSGMVDYTSEGGGTIVAHLKNVKTTYKSNDYQLHIEIKEADIKLSATDVVLLLREAVDGENR